MEEWRSDARLQVETPEAVTFDFELANIGSRGLAILLDTALLVLIVLLEVLVVGVILYLVLSAGSILALRAFAPWIAAGAMLVVFGTAWGYFVIAEVMSNGRTPGKRVLRIRVVRDDGSRVGVADSMIRNVLRIVDILPGNYAVGMASVILSSRRKRLGDMAAGTVVVRESADVVIDLDPGQRPEAEALAREFLARRGRMTPEARMQVAAEVIGALGGQLDPAWDEETAAERIAEVVGER